MEVDQPKGFNVVREAIRKLRFNQQIRKSSEGTKLPKVELTISIDGITIQDPKTKVSPAVSLILNAGWKFGVYDYCMCSVTIDYD